MSPSRRLLLAASTVATALLLSLAVTTRDARSGDDRLLRLCADALAIELWLAAAAIVCALLLAHAPGRALGLAPGRLSWASLLTLALGTLGASHALDGALDLLGLTEQSVLGELPRILAGAEGGRLALALLALGLVPGVAEELLCRGLVQRSLALRFGPALAIPAAALVFGMLHVEPIHGAFASVLGLYLGLVAHWGDSTRPAMLCHAGNNLAAVLLEARLGDVPWTPGWSLVGGSLLAGACLLAVGRTSRARPQPASGDPAGPAEA